MTAYTPTKIYSGVLTTTATTTLYTVPASTTTEVNSIVLSNTTGSAVTVTLKLGSTVLLNALSLAAGQLLSIDSPFVLAAADTITGGAGTPSAVSCFINGLQVA